MQYRLRRSGSRIQDSNEQESGGHFALSRLEVLDRGGASQVVSVAAHPEVSSAATLALTDVSELVLDLNTLPQLLAPCARGEALAQALLKPLVGRNLHRASKA